MSKNNIPCPPDISDDELDKCRESNDFTPVLFKWYKFVGTLCNFFACIQHNSAVLIPIKPLHYAVLIGLLNRCSRLMLSNVALSYQGLFGETTSIIDRCIFESCIKLTWLCQKKSEDYFEQFIADGLKTELKFKDKINENIASRNNESLVIEQRMLSSIDRYILSSKLSDDQIKSINKLPSLSDMIDANRQSNLLYLVGQKIGSHHIHGTWPSLFFHYLDFDENDCYSPRDHNCETHIYQYVVISLIVLQAMESFIQFIFSNSESKAIFLGVLESTKEEIMKINKEVADDAFVLSKI